MRDEYKSLKGNKTWIIVNRPKQKKVVELKWVLQTKLKADGSIDRRKARLVAKGFTQRLGTDYNETFALVARMGFIRLLIAIAVELELEMYQLDFISAYLNGDIEEEIFMEIPNKLYEILDKNELRKFSGDKVWLIKRALYELKQSGRQ